MLKYSAMIAAGVAALLTGACQSEASAGCEVGSGGWSCDARGTVSWVTSSNGSEINQLYDGYLFSIDTTGSNVGLPPSGIVIMTASDPNGQVVGQSATVWQRSGATLAPQTPTAIDNWLQNLSGPIGSIDVELADMPVAVQPGTNVFTMDLKYSGQTLGTAGDVCTWVSVPAGDCQVRRIAFPRRIAAAACLLGVFAFVSACASSGFYTGQSVDPLIAEGEAFAHSVSIRNIRSNPIVRSSSHRKGRKRLEVDEFVYVAQTRQPRISISIKASTPEYQEFYQWTVEKSAPVADKYVERIFGESVPFVTLLLLVGDLSDVGSSTFSRPVAESGVELIFAFDAKTTGVAPPSAKVGVFTPLETALHEAYHVLVKLVTPAQSGSALDLGKPSRIALGEAAAILFSTCADLQIFGKTLVAHRIMLNIEDDQGISDRHGTLSDRQLLEFLSGGSKLKMRDANFSGVAIFNTIWGENVGAVGYLNRADPRSENILALCTAERLRHPENLASLLREIAADGIDAPEFPEKFSDPPPSWLTPTSLP